MRTAWSLGITAAILSQTFFAIGAKAASFPDVASNNPYSAAISALADQKVINGNPDGTFAPDRTVNRAEFLTLLYRAKSMTPAVPTAACFKDVPTSSWFAAVVCDAASKGNVAGYSDKTFRPEQAVNRVEALKMMFTVLGLSQQTTLAASTQASAYTDVSASAWYMVYLSAAFKLHILPVPGVNATAFGPDQALSRAEAAAFIYNAISPSPLPVDGMSSSSIVIQQSSSSSMTSSAMSNTSKTSSSTSRRSSSSASSVATGTMTNVDVPFNDNGAFTNKLPHSYLFTLKQKTTVSLTASVTNNNTPDDVTCRLYKLDAGTSFALEYYFGYQSADSCVLRVALAPGSYQFDVTPRVANLPFTVAAKSVTGDGNDGFVEAKNLIVNTPSSNILDTNDYGDYFTFKLAQQMNMMIELSNADKVRCVIYPMEDVDIYGFSEPNCGAQYDFPAGTYYIGIMQKDDHASKQGFSVRYKN